MKAFLPRILITLCALIALASAAPAQEVLWRTHVEAGNQSVEKGNYGEAEKHYTAALKSAEGFGQTDSRLMSTMRKLASVLDDQGKYEDAEQLYQRLITLDEKASGRN